MILLIGAISIYKTVPNGGYGKNTHKQNTCFAIRKL